MIEVDTENNVPKLKKGALVSVGYLPDGSRMPDEVLRDLWCFLNVPFEQANKFASKSSSYPYPTIKVFGPDDFIEGGEEKHYRYSYSNLEPFYGIYLGAAQTIQKVYGLSRKGKPPISDVVGIFMNSVTVFVNPKFVRKVGRAEAKHLVDAEETEETEETEENKEIAGTGATLSEYVFTLASFTDKILPTKRSFALDHACKGTTSQFAKERIKQRFITRQPL